MTKEGLGKNARETFVVSLDMLNISDEQLLQARLSSVPGVHGVEVSLFEGTVTVIYNPNVLTQEAIEQLLEQPDLLLKKSEHTVLRKWCEAQGVYVLMLVAIVLVLTSLILENSKMAGVYAFPAPLYLLINGIVVLLGCSAFYRAVANLFKRTVVNTDLLVAVTIVSTLFLGLWTEAALISLLSIVAHAFSKAVLHYTTHSSPLNTVLGARTALVRDGDDFNEVPVSDIREGQTIMVKQGMMIPVDGKITSGMAEILESSITGESSFRVRDQGDAVYAGCIAQYGSFEMTAEKVGGNVSLSYIEKLIHYAATRKTVRQSMVDSVSRMFLYISIPLVALMTVLYGQYIGWENDEWMGTVFRFALTALIALSPFALVLATPTAIYAGIRKAARRGIVFKSGDDIERLRDVNSLLLDKTGTLTYAQPEVSVIKTFENNDEEKVLSVAAMIEQKSNHPIARALMRYTKEKGIEAAGAERFLEFEGGGACAIKAGEHYKIGALWLMQDGRVIPDEVSAWMAEAQKDGLTPVLVSDHKSVIGGIAFEDKVREDAHETIKKLRRVGIKRLVMVTGDNPSIAMRLGRLLELDDVVPECMPSDKMTQLNKERSRGFIPGMVGDGINDAPALAAADVGIAMGAMSSDVAIKSADVALLRQDITSLFEAVKIGRQIIRTTNFNIALALIVDVFMMAFVLLGVVELNDAIMAQIAVVVIVLLTSLRLYVRKV